MWILFCTSTRDSKLKDNHHETSWHIISGFQWLHISSYLRRSGQHMKQVRRISASFASEWPRQIRKSETNLAWQGFPIVRSHPTCRPGRKYLSEGFLYIYIIYICTYMYIYIYIYILYSIYNSTICVSPCNLHCTSTSNKHVDLSDLEVGIPRPLETTTINFDQLVSTLSTSLISWRRIDNCDSKISKGLETSFHAFHASFMLVRVAQPAEDQDKDGDQQRRQDGLQRRHRDLSHVCRCRKTTNWQIKT